MKVRWVREFCSVELCPFIDQSSHPPRMGLVPDHKVPVSGRVDSGQDLWDPNGTILAGQIAVSLGQSVALIPLFSASDCYLFSLDIPRARQNQVHIPCNLALMNSESLIWTLNQIMFLDLVLNKQWLLPTKCQALILSTRIQPVLTYLMKREKETETERLGDLILFFNEGKRSSNSQKDLFQFMPYSPYLTAHPSSLGVQCLSCTYWGTQS